MLSNNGENYKLLGDYEKAIEIYNEGLEIIGEDGGKRGLGYLYINLAECWIHVGDQHRAKKFIENAEEIFSVSEDKFAIAYLWLFKGMYEDIKDHEEKAWQFMQKAQRMMGKLNIPFDLGIIQLELARSLLNNGKIDKAMRETITREFISEMA